MQVVEEAGMCHLCIISLKVLEMFKTIRRHQGTSYKHNVPPPTSDFSDKLGLNLILGLVIVYYG